MSGKQETALTGKRTITKVVFIILCISLISLLFIMRNESAIAFENETFHAWPVPGFTSHRSFSDHEKKAIDINPSGVDGATVRAAIGGKVVLCYRGCNNNNGAAKTSYHPCSYGGCDNNNESMWESKEYGGKWCNEGFGNGCVIKGDDGLYYQYAHLQKNSMPESICVGARVEKNAYLGKVGSTGCSTGPHLHFEVNKGAAYTSDPNFIKHINPSYSNGELIYDDNIPATGTEMTAGYPRAVDDGEYLIVSAANSEDKARTLYMDVIGSDYPAVNATNVQLTIASGTGETIPRFDAWTLSYSNGFYTIKQPDTNMSLDVNGISLYSGANVMIGTGNGGNNQQFAIKQSGNGYMIQAKHSGFALSLAGNCENETNIIQAQNTGADEQRWLLIPYHPERLTPQIEEGRYVLLNGSSDSFGLDLPGDTGDLPNRTSVQLTETSALNEYSYFTLSKYTDGYYRITHEKSGKPIEVNDGVSTLPSNVGVYDNNDSITQRWAIIPVGGNRYRVVSRCNGYALDADGSSAFHNGTVVNAHPINFGLNQTWYFVKAENTISYNANGGTGAPDNQTKYFNQDLTLSSQVPAREGYTFAGWALTQDATDPAYAPGGIFTLNQEQTLYAVWVLQGSEMTSGYDRVVEDGEYLIVSAAAPDKTRTLYMDVIGSDYPAANATNVQLTIASGTGDTIPRSEAWTLSYSNGFYTIKQPDTNMSLDVNGGSLYSSANVMISTAHEGNNQRFAIKQSGNGYIIQAKHSGFALSLAGSCENGTNIIQDQDTGADGQRWLLIPYHPERLTPQIEEGRYVLLNGSSDSFGLDLPGDTGDLPNTTSVQLTETSALNEYSYFTLSKYSDGYYRITHEQSGKPIEVSNGISVVSANVGVYDNNGSIYQRWAIIPVGGDRYRVVSRCNGYALDADASSAFHNGTVVNAHPINFGINQTWYFVKAENTISYNANGGTGAPDNQTKYFNQDLTLSSQVPTREGYTFAGWALTQEATEPAYAPEGIFALNQEQTLYAVWTPAEITEIIAPESLEITAGDKAKLNLGSKPAGMDLSGLTYEFSNPNCAYIDNENYIHALYVPGVSYSELTITADNGVRTTVTIHISGNITESWEVYINGQPINTAMTVDVYKVGQTVPYRVEYEVTNNYDPGYELELIEEYSYPLTVNPNNRTITFTEASALDYNFGNAMMFKVAGSSFGYGDMVITDDQQSMYLPANTTIIGEEAFSGSKAKFFFLPAGVTEIGDNAFPAGTTVFLNTGNLNSYDFQEDGVCFIETGSTFNPAFKEGHAFYRVKRGTEIPAE